MPQHIRRHYEQIELIQELDCYAVNTENAVCVQDIDDDDDTGSTVVVYAASAFLIRVLQVRLVVVTHGLEIIDIFGVGTISFIFILYFFYVCFLLFKHLFFLG